LGGGYVETFAYDSDLQRREPSATRVEIEIETVKNRFTLADMIATSGAAPVAVTGRLGRLGALVFGFPQFSHWPVIESRSWARLDSGDELNHGDGGLLDNLGVMPLLARGVRNIIVFINTETRFAMLGNGEWRIYDDVTNLFQGDSSDSPLNRVVFEDGPARLAELARAYQVLQSQGRPLVHCASYRVRPNPIYNIFTSYEPNICWVYLDRSRAWLETLDRNGATEGSMLAHLLVPDDIFQNIPHYRTFFENLEVRRLLESAANGQIDKSDFIARFRAFKDEDLRIIKLYPEQVVGLSQLTAWTVCESAQVLSAHMPEVFENASTSCRDQ
jgi:hypothetical protein